MRRENLGRSREEPNNSLGRKTLLAEERGIGQVNASFQELYSKLLSRSDAKCTNAIDE
jgi:hypothetical protein